jgi:hypothetical protein
MNPFKNKEVEVIKARNKELEEEAKVFLQKEKTWMNLHRTVESGVGKLLNVKSLSPIMDYIYQHKVEKVTLVATVENTKILYADLEECFAGFWYGVKVMDGEKVFFEIPTLIEGDSCFVSEIASTRRKKNRFLMNVVAEYMKLGLEGERQLGHVLKEVELKEELKVGKLLFN